MPYDNELDPSGTQVPKPPRTLGEEQRMLKKGEKSLTDDDLFGYAGHLAGDDVLTAGHNSGKKPKGTVGSASIARRGYRKLPGTAVNQIGCGRGEAPTELPPPRHVREQMARDEAAFKKSMAKLPHYKPKPMDVRIVADARRKKRK